MGPGYRGPGYGCAVEPDEQRAARVAISEAMAPGWERRRERIDEALAPVRRWLVGAIDPSPGQTVLELGAASGDTGLEAAALLGDEGRLIATDLTEAMVAVGRRRAAEVGARNVEHRVMDAERIDLPDGSVDAVVCRFAYMLMADPGAALAGTRRVLRPGGRVALSVWAAPERNPWQSVGAGVLRELGLAPPPAPGEPSPFGLADEARLRGLLDGAGLVGARLEEVEVAMEYRDAADWLDLVTDTSGLIGQTLRALGEADRAALRERLAAAYAPFAGPDGMRVPGVALCALAASP
jgi:SAM-dependent methyltransferase